MPFIHTRTSPVGRTVWYAGTDAQPGSLLTGDLTIHAEPNPAGFYGVRVTANTLTSLREEEMLPARHDGFCVAADSAPGTCGCRYRAIACFNVPEQSALDSAVLGQAIGLFPISVSIAGRPDITDGVRSVEDRKNLREQVTDAGFRRVNDAPPATPSDRKALEFAIGYDPVLVRVGGESIRTYRTATDRDDTVHRILAAGFRLHPTITAHVPTEAHA